MLEGKWPKNDLRRAFVAGAKWWEWKSTGFTMWNSDVSDAEAEAEKRYKGRSPQQDDGGQMSFDTWWQEHREHIHNLMHFKDVDYIRVAFENCWLFALNDTKTSNNALKSDGLQWCKYCEAYTYDKKRGYCHGCGINPTAA